MSEFVYGGGTLPSGKVDQAPLVGDPMKNVTAAEWNSVMQALEDMKAAFLGTVGTEEGVVQTNAVSTPSIGNFSAFMPGWIDGSGTPGNIDASAKGAGIVSIPAGQTSVKVSNDDAAAVVGAIVTPMALDANGPSWFWVTMGGDGSFTIHVNTALDADMPFTFLRIAQP